MFCPNCGKEIKPDDLFCTSCGTKLDFLQQVAQEQPDLLEEALQETPEQETWQEEAPQETQGSGPGHGDRGKDQYAEVSSGIFQGHRKGPDRDPSDPPCSHRDPGDALSRPSK